MGSKQIGIITFHSADNYGAVLQAYALQHYIETHITPNVEIINYIKKTEKKKSIFHGSTHNPIKNVILNIIHFIHHKDVNARHERFEDFRKSFLHLSRPYLGEKALTGIEPKDFYITGSDQVFNPRLTDYKAYYLYFNKHSGKKIAYAPSFGISTFNNEITERILPLLSDFDTISCREKSGADYLSQIIQKRIVTVLDPVFLLSKEEWSKLAIKPQTEKKYLLVYCLSLGQSPKMLKLANEIAKQENLKIMTIGTSKPTNNHNKRHAIGPQEFLSYFLYADFILTDSFHGTSFSLIFEKRHLSFIANKDKGTRIENIMNIFGKGNEVIHNIDNYSYIPENIQIPNPCNIRAIQESKQFLQENLK